MRRVATTAVVVAVLATLLPAWWFVVDGDTFDVVLISVVAVATAGGVVALLAVRTGRPVLAALALLATAVAPTYFFYIGNLVCLVVALGLVLARRRLV